MDNKLSLPAIILAAGKSARFWPLNARHKSLLKIMGKPLIWYTINALREIGIGDIIIIQGPSRDIEIELNPFNLKNINYAIQPQADGMSGAMFAAQAFIKSGQFIVVHAHSVDCASICVQLFQKSLATKSKIILAGQETTEPWLYGCARFDGDRLQEIVEKPIAGAQPSNIKIIGAYLLDISYFDYLKKVRGTVHFNKEFEAAISVCAAQNDVRLVLLEKNYPTISFKYPWHLFNAQKYLFDKFLTQSQIDPSAQIAKNAIIEGNVFLGANCRIYEGAVIKGPCYIGANSIIGNNSVVRGYCNLEENSLVGALCETARVIFQSNVHVHSGYLGDSIFDSGMRVGAGAITANVRFDRSSIFARVQKEQNGIKAISPVDTGLTSLGTIIGANSKIGVRTTFMPGRFIGNNCRISPGQVIMHNLEDNNII